MSYGYLSTETEEEVKHGDDPEQEIKYEEMLVANGVLERTSAEQSALDAKTSVEKQTKMVMIVCSCGHAKCPCIPIFGHPVPVFEKEIQPIWSQMERDIVARRLKMLG
jgi:hypothetical protein